MLAHSGAGDDPDDREGAAGEIVDEAAQMSPAVDVVIAGHSHSLLNLRVPNAGGVGDKLVVEALSYGVAYDRVDIAVDRASGDVVAKAAAVPSTSHADVAGPDGETAGLVRRYADRVAPLAKRVVGGAATPLTRANGRLGALAAAAQRELAGTDFALVNQGSLRADLDAGALLYEELFAVHPYDFPLLRVELRGAAIAELIAARRGGDGPAVYVAGPERIDPAATYTVAANEWMATGAGFPTLRAARRLTGSPGSEAEALTRYVERRR